MPTPEGLIENAILDYLNAVNILAWKTKSVGTYDPIKGIFRKRNPRYRLGVSDIIGIYKGIPLAIEVKAPKGRVSEHQFQFLADFAKAGGIAMVARSVQDVIKGLKAADEKRRSA